MQKYLAGQAVFSSCFTGAELFQCCLYFLSRKFYVIGRLQWSQRLMPDLFVASFVAVLAVFWKEVLYLLVDCALHVCCVVTVAYFESC